MFEKLEFQNFRGFKELAISGLKQFNIFVGKNNCGKSTLMEGVFLLINPPNPDLVVKINAFRQLQGRDDIFWSVLFHEMDIRLPIKLKGILKKPKEYRQLMIEPNFSSAIQRDSLTKAVKNKPFEIEQSHSGTSSRVNGLQLEFKIKKSLKKKYDKYISSVTIGSDGVKVTQPTGYNEHLLGVYNFPGLFPADMGQRLDQIQLSKQKHEVIKVLKNMEPELVDITLGYGGTIYCDIGLDKLIPINSLGDGFRKFAALVLSIYASKNGIVIIDEFENGLHYTSQKYVWEAAISAAKQLNVQLFVTTHSFESIKSLSTVIEENRLGTSKFKLYRMEKKHLDYSLISYDYNTLRASLTSDWEVR